jgi:hypothetical protein
MEDTSGLRSIWTGERFVLRKRIVSSFQMVSNGAELLEENETTATVSAAPV